MKRADDLMEEELAEEEDVKCPEGGFHRDPYPDEMPDPENPNANEPDVPKAVTERIELLRNIVDHSRHFMSMIKRPQWQVLALDIVSRAVVLMRMNE